ncbi:PQQ-dependent dehydrogenase, methanol/ethanol family [Kordiimonas pumila]|uniref:PQQ-dependent dehydrogenase, methanol/ethanol family n=1 Tax=Kordiimonas pumila TaxID=2161677 RepID=A0ABV7D6V3_9PROT|nr:PQQ-dependent dehydrogenase, methanol/ethanol family [Kordiimonas pumila]
MNYQYPCWLGARIFLTSILLVISACSPGGNDGDQDWAMYGRDAGEQRFATLDQINAGNVDQLGVAWYADIEARSLRGVEATPIVVGGVMYVSGPWSVVMAVNAETGEQLWAFDPEVPGATTRKVCCDVVNRGVAVSNGKVLVATLDGRLIALDAQSGEVAWSVVTVDQTKSYSITGAPRVVGDLVIIGNSGAEYGVRGFVTAYQVSNGKQAWRFYTVPGNPADGFENEAMAKAAETWNGEWWKYGGGGTVWDSMAYDPDLDLLYIGVGNGSPWNVSIRSPGGGDNLYLSSIVALRPKTGEYVWHFQTTPGDQWDYTATQHMILADIKVDGQRRKVIMQAPKNGFFYVLDRETGEFISGKEYVPMTWAKGLDPKTGRPNIVPEALYSNTADAEPYLGMPSPAGGHGWQPMSYNPETGLVYFPVTELPYGYTALNADDFEFRSKGWNTGEDPSKFSMPEDPEIRKQIRSMMKGKLVAWDPVEQKQVWSVPMIVPWNGGTLSTSGGLVFQGNGVGYIAAYSAETGEKLWSHYVSTGVVAPPISYSIKGTQYISVAVGWGGILPINMGEPLKKGIPPRVNRVVTFKLGGTAVMEGVEADPLDLDPPAATASESVVNAGRVLYHTNCWMCHGDSAVNNGGVPNLRYSPVIAHADMFKAFVLGGAAEESGMPNFSGEVTPEQLEAIRAYVIKRANDLKENPDMP